MSDARHTTGSSLPRGVPASAPAVERVDAALALLLAAVTFGYLAALPFCIVAPPDEAHSLHQAVRLLGGEALYSDLFDLATPLWTYLMAGSFALFGATLATARLSVAAVHAGIALVVFLLCRRLGVRRSLAAVAALAPLVLCQPVYPVANRHWLATLFCLLLLAWCTAARRGARWGAVAGGLVGLLIATHQQRGVVMGLGVLVWLCAEALLARRYRQPRDDTFIATLVAFAVAALLVVGSVLAAAVARAGVGPVWYALIVHPLTHYRGTIRTVWGMTGQRTGATTIPLVLQFAWIVLVVAGARAVFLAWRRANGERARLLLLFVAFGTAALFSIGYFPDLAHLAFVAPILFVVAAESAEWLLRALPVRAAAAIAFVAALLFVAVSATWLEQRRRHEQFLCRDSRLTAFGRVALPPMMGRRYDALEKLLDASPQRVLYVHPISSFIYLMHGARNPTRFEFLQPGSYNSAEQVREVIDVLRRDEVPYVVVLLLPPRRKDPIMDFVRDAYEPVKGIRDVWKRKEKH